MKPWELKWRPGSSNESLGAWIEPWELQRFFPRELQGILGPAAGPRGPAELEGRTVANSNHFDGTEFRAEF